MKIIKSPGVTRDISVRLTPLTDATQTDCPECPECPECPPECVPAIDGLFICNYNGNDIEYVTENIWTNEILTQNSRLMFNTELELRGENCNQGVIWRINFTPGEPGFGYMGWQEVHYKEKMFIFYPIYSNPWYDDDADHIIRRNFLMPVNGTLQVWARAADGIEYGPVSIIVNLSYF
jgi:hypothetical protein